jgi:hypothetical protein
VIATFPSVAGRFGFVFIVIVDRSKRALKQRQLPQIGRSMLRPYKTGTGMLDKP